MHKRIRELEAKNKQCFRGGLEAAASGFSTEKFKMNDEIMNPIVKALVERNCEPSAHHVWPVVWWRMHNGQ